MESTKLVLPLTFLTLIILAMNFSEISAQTGSSIASPTDFSKRHLLQTNNVSDPVAQRDDTVRVDPLDNLKKYRGGYNLTNKHYWSSTAFTGIYGYAIGLFWLLCGLLYGGFLLVIAFCCKKRRYGKLKKGASCHKHCYFWSILLAVLFTVLAIVATGLVLGGNAKFNSRARTVVNIIIDTANHASETIYNTTGAIKDLKNNMEATQESNETSLFLSSASVRLEVEAADIERQARKNRRLIDKGLKIVYAVTTVTISVNLVAVLALSISGVLRFQRALYLLIIFCWFLTFFCWVLFGVYFFLDKFSSDTCTALENFQENPNNNTLSSILPCDNLRSAESVLVNFGTKVYNEVNRINDNLSTSFPDGPRICNPFSGPPEYQYRAGSCPGNTIRIGDIPEALKFGTCSDPNNGTCGQRFVIPDDAYRTVEAYTSSIQQLLNVYPDMQNLIECQSVKNAFSEILDKHCKPLKRYAHMVWASLVTLSIIMVFLVLLWTDQAHHEQEFHSSDGPVKSHSVTANVLEPEKTNKSTEEDQSNPSLV